MNSEYRKGFVLTLLGVLIFTPDALLIRLTNLEFFSLTVGRGTIGGLAMLLGLALYYRRDFKKQILGDRGLGLGTGPSSRIFYLDVLWGSNEHQRRKRTGIFCEHAFDLGINEQDVSP